MNGAQDSAKGTVFKTALLENDESINVPEFIQVGDKITVDLAQLKYLARLK